MENAVAVAVDGDRQAVRVREDLEQDEIAMRVLSVPEGGGEDMAGRVVDRRKEDQARATSFEPVMGAPVDLHQQAGLWHPLPASTVAQRATASGAAQAHCPEDTMDRRLGQRQVFSFGQEFAEVRVVDPGIGGLGEAHNPLPDRIAHPARGSASTIPMDQGFGAPAAIRSAEPADLTDG